MIIRLARLKRDRSGIAAIEFGILAPAIITLLLGVVQVGMWMQSYNALRSLAADTGRYVAVQYQKGESTSNIDMATWAHVHGAESYLFTSAQLTTDVTDAPVQQVSGVSEKTLTLTYNFPSFLQIVGIEDFPVTFTRPIFVKAS